MGIIKAPNIVLERLLLTLVYVSSNRHKGQGSARTKVIRFVGLYVLYITNKAAD